MPSAIGRGPRPLVETVKIKHRLGGGGRAGRIRVIDVVRRGRKMNGTKETKGGGARVSTGANEPTNKRKKEREKVEDARRIGQH